VATALPTWWFVIAFAAATVLLWTPEAGAAISPSRGFVRGANMGLLAVTLCGVHFLARGSLWSPTINHRWTGRCETTIEVNNIFHLSMVSLERQRILYQWPYMVFGDTFSKLRVLGAGFGTVVAAALKRGALHVDAVEIDPVIFQLGRYIIPTALFRLAGKYSPTMRPHS
jgi:hypothetical protein